MKEESLTLKITNYSQIFTVRWALLFTLALSSSDTLANRLLLGTLIVLQIVTRMVADE